MRILAITNLFPPHHLGGYELGCRDVLEALSARGHEVRVLTSNYGVDRLTSDGAVLRWLTHDFGWWTAPATPLKFLRLAHREWTNRRLLAAVCRSYRPDLVYVWNLGHVSTALGFHAQQMGFDTVYYFSDWWFTAAEADSWTRFWDRGAGVRGIVNGLARPILRLAGLRPQDAFQRFGRAQFTSAFLARGMPSRPVDHAEVIHWGIDPARFPMRQSRAHSRGLRLLYAGRVVFDKGVHTVISAIGEVVRGGCKNLTLSVVGLAQEAAYLEKLKEIVRSCELEEMVQFVGSIPRERLIQMYQTHDVYMFPSIWDEPFSIGLLEALSSGLAVVGTTSGGSAEILRQGENALIYPAGDVAECTAQIRRLLADSDLVERLGRSARQTIEERFTFTRMVDQIERSIGCAKDGGSTGRRMVSAGASG